MPHPTPLQRVHNNADRITHNRTRLADALDNNDHTAAATALAWIANDAEALAHAARLAEQQTHDHQHANDNGARLADKLARTILPDDN